jgi:hypothetical protein
MQRNRRWGLGLVVVALVASGCARAPEEEEAVEKAAKVENIAGTERVRVRLTEQAAKRLDIQTAPVQDAASAGSVAVAARVIPLAAVLYEPDGSAFTYTNPEPFVYMREPITVTAIKGDQAFVSDGPAAGTAVVTVGSAELSGVETSGFEE